MQIQGIKATLDSAITIFLGIIRDIYACIMEISEKLRKEWTKILIVLVSLDISLSYYIV